jgi:low affinity Fe/Cu permease
MATFFSRIASWAALMLGTWQAFMLAALACVLWAVSGPLFDYSDTWQLVINTATTVLTFLAVFLIQNQQNRADRATQIKLDELLCAIQEARSGLVGIEEQPEHELISLQERIREEVAEQSDATSARDVEDSGEQPAVIADCDKQPEPSQHAH